jgi:MFS family permease
MFGFEGENAREKGIVLLTMCFALAMAMLDNTVVNVAVPSIQKDLSAGFSQLQWIVDAYVLAFASPSSPCCRCCAAWPTRPPS